MFLVCNAYYNIITLYSRQAFFEYFFIFSKSTRYCTFSVFLSFILQIRLARLLLFYQFNKLSNSDYPTKANLEESNFKLEKPRIKIIDFVNLCCGILTIETSDCFFRSFCFIGQNGTFSTTEQNQ